MENVPNVPSENPVIVTDSGTKKVEYLGKWWCFTYNNYDDSVIDLFQDHESFDKWCFQEEVGEKTQTPHLQGFVRWRTKKRLSTVCNEFKGCHWERMIGTVAQNIAYCTKQATRPENGKRWVHSLRVQSTVRTIVKKDFKKWQTALYELVVGVQPDTRSIHWWYDKAGNSGKTALAKYLAVYHGAIVVGGKTSDMKYGIMKASEKDEVNLVIIDIPRCSQDYVSYKGIEEIKNGMFFNNKYESCMCLFNSPTVIVFANEEPKYYKLSADRWKVINIDEF